MGTITRRGFCFGFMVRLHTSRKFKTKKKGASEIGSEIFNCVWWKMRKVHYVLTKTAFESACGVQLWTKTLLRTQNLRKVSCKNCRKTKEFKEKISC